jgi:hypothetical protein
MGRKPLLIVAASTIAPPELTIRRPLRRVVPLFVPPRAMGKTPLVSLVVDKLGISFDTRDLNEGTPAAAPGEAKTRLAA